MAAVDEPKLSKSQKKQKEYEKKAAVPKTGVEEDLVEQKSEVEVVAPVVVKEGPKKPLIVGLSGAMAVKGMGKQAKKKIAEEKRRQEEEE